MSLLGVPMLLGPILGPVLGGLIVDSASWRWIFYVNLPIGIVAIVLALRILPGHEPTTASNRLDVRGLLLLSPGLALVVFGLAQAGQGSTVSVVAPIVVGTAMVVAFVLHALRAKITPLIEVVLFRNRSFAAAAATTFCFGAALYGGMLLLPLYYQVVRGDSALNAGLLMAPQGIGAALVMPLAGKLTDRFGAGRIVPGGLVVVRRRDDRLHPARGPHLLRLLAGSLFVRGVGFGFVMMPAMAAAYQDLSRERVPRASTAINIVQRVGGSIGTALVAVVLDPSDRRPGPRSDRRAVGGVDHLRSGAGPAIAPAAGHRLRAHLLVAARIDRPGPGAGRPPVPGVRAGWSAPWPRPKRDSWSSSGRTRSTSRTGAVTWRSTPTGGPGIVEL